MHQAVVQVMSFAFVVGCRFDLPEAGVAEPADAPADALPPDGPAAGCPATYGPLPNDPANPHRYRRAPNVSPWPGQRNFCENSSPKAYLAVPNDATELMGLLMIAGGAAPIWVGIEDQLVEGTFVTIRPGGPAAFLPWASGQPDNANGNEDCVAATATSFSDQDCLAPGGVTDRPAVCECEP